MNKRIFLISFIAGFVIVLCAIIGTYNGLVKSEAKVETALSDVQVQLQRRSDLIPNLVNTVKGYADHEEDVYKEVADARAKLAGAKTVEEISTANNKVSSALSRLLAISESYPELNSNENFLQLQDELAGTENRIGVARKDYNEAAQEFNIKVKKFPTNIIANMMGFDKCELFQAEESAQNAPKVEF